MIDAAIYHSVNLAIPQVLTPPHDYTAVNRRPSNNWTSMQKVILGWLTSSYSNSITDIARIFNACFRDELPTRQGLSENAINTKRYSMQLKTDEKAAVVALQSSSCTLQSVDFVSVARSLVKRTASDLSVELLENKPGLSLRATKATKSQKSKRKKLKIIDHDRHISDNDSDSDLSPQPSAKRFCTPNQTSMDQYYGLLSPPSTKKINRHLQNSLLSNRTATNFKFDLQASSFAYQDANLSTTSHSADRLTNPPPHSLDDMQDHTKVTPNVKRHPLPRLAFRAFDLHSMGTNTSQLFGTSFESLIP